MSATGRRAAVLVPLGRGGFHLSGADETPDKRQKSASRRLLDGLDAGETPTKDEARKIADVIAALGNSRKFGLADSARRSVPTTDAANDTEGWDEEPIAESVGG